MADNHTDSAGPSEDVLVIGAKGGAVAFILKIISTALGFLNQVILARILGAGGIGEVLLALSVVNVFVQIAKFGMGETMMRFVPAYIDQKDDARLKGTIYFALKFTFLFSIIFVFFLLLSSRFISINIFHAEGLLKLLPIVAVSVPATVIKDVIKGVLKGYRDVFKAILPEFIISPIMRIGIFLLLTLKGVFPLYAIIAFVSGEIFVVLLSIGFLFKKLEKIRPVKQLYERKKILDVACAVIVTSISALVYNQADLWMLGIFTTTEVVGIYGASAKLVALTSFPMMASATIIPSLMSSLHVSGNHKEMREVVSKSSRWILSIAMPMILFLILEGRFILKYIYGEKFEAGYIVLVILSIGQLIKVGTGLSGFLLQMTGWHKNLMKITVFSGILNICLNILLIPPFGMLGAAVSITLCVSMVNLASIFVIYKKLSISILARGLKFDAVFLAIVGLFYSLFTYGNSPMGIHLLFIAAVTIYMWKSITNNDIPWRLLIAKHKTTKTI